MEWRDYQNPWREGLESRQFVVSIEFVTPQASEELEGAIAPLIELAEHIKADPRFAAIALTDRVRSDHDHDPVVVASRVVEACRKMPIVHLSGKDRDPKWLADAVDRAQVAGLENLLLVTGDKIRGEPADGRRVRYLDSVHMLLEGRTRRPKLHLAVAVSPFKYREEELMNQYLKMIKKARAGADCLITQVGWDMLKMKELMAYRQRRGLAIPVVAGVMLLTAARGRYIRTHRLAGITITDELQARLEEEATQPDRGLGIAYRRLALQIVGVKRLGFAGVQLTGLHQFDKLARLFQQVEGLDRGLRSEGGWWDAWWHSLREPGRGPTRTAPDRPFYLFEELTQPGGWMRPVDRLTLRDLDQPRIPNPEVRRSRRLDRLDEVIFREGSRGAALLTPLARLVRAGSVIDRSLHWVERRVKAPIVGCQTCGFCRLPSTSYVCPETCPKGLANGPCGGTSENTCEFGHQECIHNRTYRVAKAFGRLRELEEIVVPLVPAEKRGTCSWTNHFRGEDPPVLRLTALGGKESSA
jgi:methylenetetrahydrofolate reductase (NADPH)